MDDPDLKARRAASFGAAARSYAEHRPSYPDAAVAWILEPVRDRRIVRVLDLGAGTGRVTEALQRAEVDVIAVEPDAEMRAVMLERVFGVAVLAGAAEDIPLPDERVDAVVVGQAFHWFDAERAYPEIARVLKPGGVLAAMWNAEDVRVPWVAEYARMIGYEPDDDAAPEPSRGAGAERGVQPEPTNAAGPEAEAARPGGARAEAEGSAGASEPAAAAGPCAAVVPSDPPFADDPAFEPPVAATFHHFQRRTADSLVATRATHSAVLVLPEQERAAHLEAVRDFLRSQPETADGVFELPLITTALRTIRR